MDIERVCCFRDEFVGGLFCTCGSMTLCTGVSFTGVCADGLTWV